MPNAFEMTPCVIVADREIGDNAIMSPNMVCYGPGGNRFQMSPNYLHLLAQREYSAECDPPSLPWSLSEVEREEQGLRSMGFGEVVDAIGSSRVRLSILLDTSGGTMLYRRYLEMIQWYLGRTGGEFSAYGGEEVASLGALILGMPPKGFRYAHPHSKIRFHLPQGSPYSNELEREDIAELKELLMGLASSGNRRRMRSVLGNTLLAENPATPDRRVEFYGKFAEELGLLKALSASEMRSHFLRGNSLSGESISGTPIAQFFDRLSSYEREAQGAFRGIMEKMEIK
jgi:hypothetical protein